MQHSKLVLSLFFGLVTLSLAFPILALGTPSDDSYPYGSPSFTKFVGDSYGYAGLRNPARFYHWMDAAYRIRYRQFPYTKYRSLDDFLAAGRRRLNRLPKAGWKAEEDILIGARIHRLVKTMIPRFSLDRGFEFTNAVRYGERQCLLQSVLIAGLMQTAGVRAGVAMVYRSIEDRESNNGHAVTLVKLPNGQDIIVDGSEPKPFARQRGLFVRTGDYQYVEPVYHVNSSRILYYRAASDHRRIRTDQVRPMDTGFVESQFWYYRGERVPGGLISARKTREGIARAAANLGKSVKLCPNNPLAVYMLGRAYLEEGRTAEAYQTLRTASELYTRFGWLPNGPKQYLAKVSRRLAKQGP